MIKLQIMIAAALAAWPAQANEPQRHGVKTPSYVSVVITGPADALQTIVLGPGPFSGPEIVDRKETYFVDSEMHVLFRLTQRFSAGVPIIDVEIKEHTLRSNGWTNHGYGGSRQTALAAREGQRLIHSAINGKFTISIEAIDDRPGMAGATFRATEAQTYCLHRMEFDRCVASFEQGLR